MRHVDPDKVFQFTLPNGEKVTAWKAQRKEIRRDVNRLGTVMLIKDPDTGVWTRVDPTKGP